MPGEWNLNISCFFGLAFTWTPFLRFSEKEEKGLISPWGGKWHQTATCNWNKDFLLEALVGKTISPDKMKENMNTYMWEIHAKSFKRKIIGSGICYCDKLKKKERDERKKANQHLCLIIFLDKRRWKYSNLKWIHLLENLSVLCCLINSGICENIYSLICNLWFDISFPTIYHYRMIYMKVCLIAGNANLESVKTYVERGALGRRNVPKHRKQFDSSSSVFKSCDSRRWEHVYFVH